MPEPLGFPAYIKHGANRLGKKCVGNLFTSTRERQVAMLASKNHDGNPIPLPVWASSKPPPDSYGVKGYPRKILLEHLFGHYRSRTGFSRSPNCQNSKSLDLRVVRQLKGGAITFLSKSQHGSPLHIPQFDDVRRLSLGNPVCRHLNNRHTEGNSLKRRHGKEGNGMIEGHPYIAVLLDYAILDGSFFLELRLGRRRGLVVICHSFSPIQSLTVKPHFSKACRRSKAITRFSITTRPSRISA